MRIVKVVSLWILVPTIALFVTSIVLVKTVPALADGSSFVNADESIEFVGLGMLSFVFGLLVGTIGSCVHLFKMRALIVMCWTIGLTIASAVGVVLGAIAFDGAVPEAVMAAALVMGVVGGFGVGVIRAIVASRRAVAAIQNHP